MQDNFFLVHDTELHQILAVLSLSFFCQNHFQILPHMTTNHFSHPELPIVPHASVLWFSLPATPCTEPTMHFVHFLYLVCLKQMETCVCRRPEFARWLETEFFCAFTILHRKQTFWANRLKSKRLVWMSHKEMKKCYLKNFKSASMFGEVSQTRSVVRKQEQPPANMRNILIV